MSRKWTARKTTLFNEAAVDSTGYARPYPVFRAGMEQAVARKEVLRLLAGFTFLGLPVHWGIGWLAGHSLGLAVAAVLVTAGALLAVAFARWLQLEELLQRLPLLLLVALLGVGLAYLSSLPMKGWGGGGTELFGSVFILIAVVSVVGGLYRPLAAAYRTITLSIPFRDLCVAAAAMLVSLGVAVASQTLPKGVLPLITCVLAGGLAGLVVTEYAAWARANPARSLKRMMAFDGPVTDTAGEPRKAAPCIDRGGAFLGAALFGFSFGLCAPLVLSGEGPALAKAVGIPDFQLLLGPLGLLIAPAALVMVSSALNSLRPPRPDLAFRLAWDALVVFLTYPDTAHPLAHWIHTPWLRPLSVRLAAAVTVLVAMATTFTVREASPMPAEPQKPAPAAAPAAPQLPWTPRPQPAPRFIPEGDREAARIEGRNIDDLMPRPFEAPTSPASAAPATPGGTAPETPPTSSQVPHFVFTAIAAVLLPPVFLYAMVWLVGAAALPNYFHHFETPETPETPR